jgi:hypothetical protein
MSDCNNNCPEKTSDITLFDGTFNNITVPDGSSLNDVLALLETYFTNQINGVETSYTLESDSACLGLTAGTYSLQQMVQAIILKVCENSDSIQDILNQIGGISLNVNTTDVELDGIVGTTCSSGPGGFVGTTSTDLFNYILDQLCGIEEGIDFNPTTDDVDSDSVAAVSWKGQREVTKSMVDNDYIISQTTPATNPASFASSFGPLSAIIDGYYVNKSGSTSVALLPNSDKYYALRADGQLFSQEGANGFPYVQPPNTLLLYKFVSDGAGITGVTIEGGFDAFNPTPLGVDDVDTVNIRNGAVTSVKLDDVVVGDTKGSSAIIEITYNNKGQITNVNSSLNIGAITNGQGIAYNSGTLAFEPVDLLSINSFGFVPVSDGTDLVNSSILENGSQVQFGKQVAINEGGAIVDSDALFNLVSTDKYFRIMRMTAAEAGLLPLNDAAMIYVTTTDATFTSVGFWGVENGAWVKL